MRVRALSALGISEDVSVGEITASIGTAAIAAATLYNFGYFARLQWSFISLLNLQDLLLGALVAVPIVVAIATASPFYISVAASSKTMRSAFWGRVLAGSIFVFAEIVDGVIERRAGANFICFMVLLTALLLSDALRFHAYGRRFAKLVMGAVVLLVPAAMGFSYAYSQTQGAPTHLATVTFAVGPDQTGKILRTTSSYLFLYDGGSVSVIPLSSVAKIVQKVI